MEEVDPRDYSFPPNSSEQFGILSTTFDSHSLNASFCPYDPSYRLLGIDQSHLTCRSGRAHRIFPHLGKCHTADRRRRQRRLRYQSLPGERRAVHEPQLQVRHSSDDRGAFS